MKAAGKKTVAVKQSATEAASALEHYAGMKESGTTN